MIFSSILFLLYFLPFFLLAYILTPQRFRNYVALAGSLLFYSWGAPLFVFALIASAISDYALAMRMSQTDNQPLRKQLLAIGLVINLGTLAFFKYFNFFAENIDHILGALGTSSPHWLEIALPIGISFFTFQKISFLMDIYRGEKQQVGKLTDYLLFVCLFPQLIAGPIIRFKDIATQLIERSATDGPASRTRGIFRFVIGLSKKVLIANVLGQQVDLIFALPESALTFYLAWIGIVAYAFQIYFDFAGYSDMAIGLGLMMGFDFPENFNFPYISRNITEFWRRWHITLSSWMKDYLYIPLGGNRVSNGRLYLNLGLVFLLSGLWHGAKWNFVAWGAFHGLFLIADRLFLLRFTERIGRIPSIILTFFIVLIGWVFFRADSLPLALDYLSALFDFGTSTEGIAQIGRRFWTMGALGAFFSFIGITAFGKQLEQFYQATPNRGLDLGWRGFAVVVLLILCIGEIAAGGFNPFIYFRF